MSKLFTVCLLALIATLAAPTSIGLADTGAVDVVDAAAAVVTPLTAVAADATAAVAVSENHEVHDLLVSVVQSAQAGNWKLAVAGLLFLSMFVLRKFKLPFLKGDRGGAIAVMLLALLGALGTALAGGADITLSLFTGAVGIAFTSVGGFTWVKRVWKPRDAQKPTA